MGNINPYRWQKICESLYKLGLTNKCIDIEKIIFDYEKIQEKRNAMIINRTINILILSNLEDLYIREEKDEEYFVESINRGKILTRQMSNTIEDFRYFFNSSR